METRGLADFGTRSLLAHAAIVSASDSSLDTGRLLRLLVLIAAVSAVFLLTAREVVSGTLFSIAVVVIGAVALVTAITDFLISAASSVRGVGE